MTPLPVLVRITDATEVYLTHTMLDKPVDGLLQIAFLEVPIAGKVVHHTIGYHTQRNLVAHLLLHPHQTVHGIVQCRVATSDDNGAIAVMDEHVDQTLHTVSRLALYEVVLHLAVVEHLLNLLTLLAVMCLGTIQNAPPCIRFAHK